MTKKLIAALCIMIAGIWFLRANSLAATGHSKGDSFAVLIYILAFLYFIPSVIGIIRKHHNLFGLIALNVLLGWTILGWVGALIWSLLRSSKSQTIIYNSTETLSKNRIGELEQLNNLKNAGGITEEEYQNEKTKILNS